MSSNRQSKILVIRGGAIGDFILTLPVLAALREQFPQTRLEVLGYPHIALLAEAGGLVDRVQSIEARALAGFFAPNGELDIELAAYFAEFALIISYLYDPDLAFQTNVKRCSDAQFIAGPHRPNDQEDVHATDVFLKPLERLAIFGTSSVPQLPIPHAFETTITTGRWLAIHPGSGSPKKNWPQSRWVELLQRLVNTTTLHFLLVGGEAERDRLDDIAKELPATRTKLLQSVPLPELAAWLGSCVAYAGHDSGISHLAAAMGVPCLILWGETAEAVWRPRAREMTIVRDLKGLDHLAVEVAQNHLEQLINRCHPK